MKSETGQESERRVIIALKIGDIASFSAIASVFGVIGGILLPFVGVGAGTIFGVLVGGIIGIFRTTAQNKTLNPSIQYGSSIQYEDSIDLSMDEMFVTSTRSKHLKKTPLSLRTESEVLARLISSNDFLDNPNNQQNVTICMLSKSINAYTNGQDIVEVLKKDGVESNTASMIDQAVKHSIRLS